MKARSKAVPEGSFKAGVACMVVKDEKVLLGKRINVSHEGCAGLPGGRIDEGEHPIEAAVRELKEETGIVAVNPTFLSVTSTYHVKKVCFLDFVYWSMNTRERR